MSGPMTTTEKHRETAREVFRDYLKCIEYDRRPCFEHDELIQELFSTALAKAEREGMKHAAEIASLDADWSRFGKREVHEPWEGGPDDARDYRIGIVAGRAIAAAILSEAGED